MRGRETSLNPLSIHGFPTPGATLPNGMVKLGKVVFPHLGKLLPHCSRSVLYPLWKGRLFARPPTVKDP